MFLLEIMCLICKNNAKILQLGNYRRCEFCKTYISKNLPDYRGIEKILEEHALTYIIDNQESEDSYTNIARLAQLKKYSKSIQTILDFGCGSGSLVKFLRAKGFNVFGYDKSELIKKSLLKQNIPFYNDIGEIPNNYFDIVTCFDVVEHTTNPWILIRTIKNKLKKGGILIISTPNSQSFSAKILGERWWVFGPAAHYILFSTFSLKLLLKHANWKILDICTDTLTPWFIPVDKLLSMFLNKIIYIVLLPFQKILFSHNLGDNIQIVARK